MSVIAKWKHLREVARLKKVAELDGTPSSIAALAERLIAFGRPEDACRVAADGLSRFPASQRLNAVHRFVTRTHQQEEIARLRQELSENPRPLAFMRIAEVQLRFGEADAAIRTCESCAEAYPLDENPFLVMGEARILRFLSDLTGKDATLAEQHLRRVVKLNRQNLKAWLLLSRLYFVIGAGSPLLASLKEAAKLAPGVPELEQMIERVKAGHLALGLPPEALVGEEEEPEEEPRVADLIRAAEVHGTLRNPPEDFQLFRASFLESPAPRPRLDRKHLEQDLAILLSRPGARKAAVTNGNSGKEAAKRVSRLLTDPFGTLVGEIRDTAEEASRRMDAGQLGWCTVEGEFGGVTVTSAGRFGIGLFYGPEMRPEQARDLLEELAARHRTPERNPPPAEEAHRA